MDLDLGAENGPHMALGPDGTVYVTWVSGSLKASKPGGHGGHGGHGGRGGPPRPGNLNIYLTRSTDEGKTFSPPVKVNDDPDGPEHRFPSVAVDRDGGVNVVWLDKRQGSPQKPGFSRVYFARSTDGGKTFGPNVDATAGQEYGICHCCKLSLITHPREGLFVAFRNDVNDLRDIFLVHSKDAGKTFTGPRAIEDIKWVLPT
jgi:hypothetical protein